MTDLAVRVRDLGKQYRIGKAESYGSFREGLTRTFTAPFRRMGSLLRGNAAVDNFTETMWALRHVSFDIKQGEIVGVIGHNGAGKSTLLKILSSIPEPTEGQVELYGRIGALLEVGTGFHPELTGRENIYLNGAILGMSRAEIQRKFDEIVAFAEVEKFIDTPVKHYSTGMGLRLGFAVAVHLEPEILVVDEVLAVGDAQFQKKCLDKMSEIGRGGRTILFVSHNMSAMRNICTEGILLGRGEVLAIGKIDEVVDGYIAGVTPSVDQFTTLSTPSFLIPRVAITSGGEPLLKTFAPLDIQITLTAKTEVLQLGCYVGVRTPDGFRLFGLDLEDFQTIPPIKEEESVTIGFSIPENLLLPGSYQLEIKLKDRVQHKFERVPQYISFEVVDTPIYGGRKLDTWSGYIALKPRVTVTAAQQALSEPSAQPI